MRKIIAILFVTCFNLSCSQSITKKEFYKSGELFAERVYPNRLDTLTYSVIKYFPTGEVLNRFEYVNGKMEGGYYEYTPKGIVTERRNYKNDKLNGVLQYYDTTGLMAREEYFIDGKRVLFCPSYKSNNGKFIKQEYCYVKNDSAYMYGKLARGIDKDSIIREISFGPIIKFKDTVTSACDCLILEMIPPFPNLSYQYTFGKPDTKFKFTTIDTTFFTKDTLINLCNLKLAPGLNHIFCKINLSDEDSTTIYNYRDTAVMYAYKDVFFLPRKR